ncbi:MAG: metal-dependent transcriptional regulator [Gemmatimonadota bacterium]|nr:MAG: metal-dependent transcriptional regulator [Gemmatimonadota bacterium]
MTQPSSAPALTKSVEDYLKAIYELELDGTPAQTSAIATSLEVAPPSVSGMIKRLSEAGLLRHVPYRGVQLTEDGRRTALRMVRRHRVVETYLTTKLGYDWDSVHSEAERLEHAVSDELIERMAMALGNPRYDPHGAPIPTKDGAIEMPDYVSLSDVPVGGIAEFRMVGDRDAARLRFIASLGLKPGVSFEVVARQPFRGPTTIELAGPPAKEQVIGHELAESLLCVAVEKEVG